MTTQQAERTQFGEEGDYYRPVVGVWLVFRGGAWQPVTNVKELVQLQQDEEDGGPPPDDFYAMTTSWGDQQWFSHFPTSEEREETEAMGPEPVSVPKEPQKSDFFDTSLAFALEMDTLDPENKRPEYVAKVRKHVEEGKTAYAKAMEEYNTQKAASERVKAWETEQKRKKVVAEAREERRRTGPSPDKPTEAPKEGYEWELDKATNRWYEKRLPAAEDKAVSDFTDFDDATVAAARMGPWAYAKPDGKGGFTIGIDEAQRRESMEEKPARLASYDERILEAFERGDYAKAYQIDQFRDMLGADRNAIANQVMGFYLDNATADQVEEYMRNPPPLLAQAIQQWTMALNPMGMAPVDQVMAQNAQGPSWMELAQIVVANGGKVEYGPDGKKLAESFTRDKFPQGPTVQVGTDKNGKPVYSGIPAPTEADFARGRAWQTAKEQGAYDPAVTAAEQADVPFEPTRQDIYDLGENDLRGLPQGQPRRDIYNLDGFEPDAGAEGRAYAEAVQGQRPTMGGLPWAVAGTPGDRQSIYSLDETGAPGPISTSPRRDIYAREAMDEPAPPTPGQGGRGYQPIYSREAMDEPAPPTPGQGGRDITGSDLDPAVRKAQGWDTVDTSSVDYTTDVDAYMRGLDLDRPTAERYALSNQMQKAQEQERRRAVYAKPAQQGPDLASVLGPIAKAKREREYRPRTRRVIYAR